MHFIQLPLRIEYIHGNKYFFGVLLYANFIETHTTKTNSIVQQHNQQNIITTGVSDVVRPDISESTHLIKYYTRECLQTL